MIRKRFHFAFVPCVIGLCITFFLFSTVVALAGTNNLIQNGGFERNSGKNPREWRIESWMKGFSARFTSGNVRHGKGAVLIHCPKENDVRYIQTVSVKPDTVYRFSGWIATRNIPSKTLGANLSLMGTFVHSAGMTGSSPWTFQTVLFRTASKQHKVTLAARLGFYSDTTTGTAFFDDLKLETATRIGSGEKIQELEEPSSESAPAVKISTAAIWPVCIILFYLLLLWGMRWRLGRTDSKLLADRFFVLGSHGNKFSFLLLVLSCCALIVRSPLLTQAPFPSDLACFENWALRLGQIGPGKFFQKGYFCDYPPFGLLILWPVGRIAGLLSLQTGSIWYHFLVKFPGILADIGTAWLIYAIFRKKAPLVGRIAAAIYLFLPAVLYNSAYWGQVDSYYTFLTLAAFYVLVKKDWPEAAAFLITCAFLTKAQTIAFIPLLGFVLLTKYPRQRVLKTIMGALACFVLIILPFSVGKPVTWMISHYLRQAGLYPYASLNAANFHALLGGNEVLDNMPAIWGIPFNLLGIALFLAVTAWTFRFYYVKRTSGSLAAGMAMAAFSLFLLCPRMHERYLFPALAFLLVAWGYYRDRKIFFGTLILSISYLLNLHGVVQKFGNLMDGTAFNRLIYILALVNTAVFIGLVMVFHAKVSRNGSKMKAFRKRYSRELQENLLQKEETQPFKMNRRDYAATGGLLLIYGILLFLNLGSWRTPQTGIALNQPDGLEIRFGQTVSVSSMAIYDAEGTGSLRVEYPQNNIWQTAMDVSCNDYYVLRHEPLNLGGVDRLRLIPQPATGKINELAFFDAGMKPIPVKAVVSLRDHRIEPARRHPLFDEQSRVTVKPSFMNSTYFDEIYHGRTAYEFVTGSPVYETTHPPFGKDLLALGILIFGMNPFGMRFMHALAGWLLILALFALGREVLKTRFAAYALMILGMLDFMPFVQSRYATIDSTSVLLISWMFFFTLRLVRAEREQADFKKIMVNLFGIVFFFTLAAATKWTAIYGFGGVVAILGLAKVTPYFQKPSPTVLLSDRADRLTGHYRQKKAAMGFIKLLTMFFVIFLVVAPTVYFLSYLPFLHAQGVKPFSGEGLESVLNSQIDMYHYHSQLKATHPFSSSWWSWPFDFKPLWLYMDKYPPDGLKGSIVSLGNPAIWWLGALGLILLLYRMINGFNTRRLIFILICFFGLYLPWILISRVTFIYHFYPDLPWFFICGILVLEPLWTMGGGRYRPIVLGFFVMALILFLAYYPVLTGADVSQGYIDHYLRWFSRDWIF